jgi:NAD(P)-dependent dehydrogenase (short-subunit alcohol dehydrogenase family)
MPENAAARPKNLETAPQVAVVTGEASGIGRALAVALAARGDLVTVADSDQLGAARIADELRSRYPGRAAAAGVDVPDANAVVGLSLALRGEAMALGGRVSVVCPGYVHTPLLDNVNPGLPQTTHGPQTRERAVRQQGRLYPSDQLARDVLRGIDRKSGDDHRAGSGLVRLAIGQMRPLARTSDSGQVR